MTLGGALLVSYLIGSIPTAYWLVRRSKGVDIRTVGSGNVGATNALRAAGKGVGLAVLLADGLKGTVAATIVAGAFLGEAALFDRLLCGLASVIGHDFSIYLRFRGGKGVATTIGALLGAAPAAALLGMAVWAAVFLLSRYVSVASMAFAASVPVLQAVFGHHAGEVFLGALFGLILIVRHRDNIRRLMDRTEHRFSFGKNK